MNNQNIKKKKALIAKLKRIKFDDARPQRNLEKLIRGLEKQVAQEE